MPDAGLPNQTLPRLVHVLCYPVWLRPPTLFAFLECVSSIQRCVCHVFAFQAQELFMASWPLELLLHSLIMLQFACCMCMICCALVQGFGMCAPTSDLQCSSKVQQRAPWCLGIAPRVWRCNSAICRQTGVEADSWQTTTQPSST